MTTVAALLRPEAGAPPRKHAAFFLMTFQRRFSISPVDTETTL